MPVGVVLRPSVEVPMEAVVVTGGRGLCRLMSGRAILDGMPVIAGMSMVRAASENRMQQHCRNRHCLGQEPKHEFLVISKESSGTELCRSKYRHNSRAPVKRNTIGTGPFSCAKAAVIEIHGT